MLTADDIADATADGKYGFGVKRDQRQTARKLRELADKLDSGAALILSAESSQKVENTEFYINTITLTFSTMPGE